jgi:hypothetical protein
MDINSYEAPSCGALFWQMSRQKCQMQQQAGIPVLTLKGLKAQEIEMELTSVYCEEALQISALKK